ncbi:MAG: RNA polymerase subunit sigma-70 [Planctomycetes bacterium]|nr:RNA polymerase subunit sigma-70 [Planctomycetota bacterium]
MERQGDANDQTRAEPRIGEILALLRRAGPLDARGVTQATPQVEADLLRLIQDALRAQARFRSRGHPRGDTLWATTLVNEVYVKLTHLGEDGAGRDHYFDIASRAMRAVLVDHARSNRRVKRGGAGRTQPLDDVHVEVDGLACGDEPLDIVALDDALLSFAQLDPPTHHIVELSVFGGLTNAEIATILGVTKRAIEGDLKLARRWLADEM